MTLYYNMNVCAHVCAFWIPPSRREFWSSQLLVFNPVAILGKLHLVKVVSSSFSK